jgi:hypothetical protein
MRKQYKQFDGAGRPTGRPVSVRALMPQPELYLADGVSLLLMVGGVHDSIESSLTKASWTFGD